MILSGVTILQGVEFHFPFSYWFLHGPSAALRPYIHAIPLEHNHYSTVKAVTLLWSSSSSSLPKALPSRRDSSDERGGRGGRGGCKTNTAQMNLHGRFVLLFMDQSIARLLTIRLTDRKHITHRQKHSWYGPLRRLVLQNVFKCQICKKSKSIWSKYSNTGFDNEFEIPLKQ